MHQLNESDCRLIKSNFVNISVLLGLFMQNCVHGCLGLLGILVRHMQEKFFCPFKL